MKPTAEGTGAMIGEKLTAAAEVCCACHLPQAMRRQVAERMTAGHAEHAGEGLPGDLQAEAREELADVAGYAALSRMQRVWGWRWAVAVVLAGLAWRVLGDARGPPRGATDGHTGQRVAHFSRGACSARAANFGLGGRGRAFSRSVS